MKNILRHILISIACYLAFAPFGVSQNSLLGDGFGGRSWYQSYNYSVGSYSGYTVCGDSDQLYAWGGNYYGQLGDGTKIASVLPVKVKGLSNVSYYTAGYYSAAIKKDSTAWVWGKVFDNGPVKKVEDVKFVCAGTYFVSFVKHDGTVWSIGQNTGNAFGDTSAVFNALYENPVQMIHVTEAVRVSNCYTTTIVLLSDGRVMSVGQGDFGQLGLGFNNKSTQVPTLIPDLYDIVDIKSTADFTLALNKFGEVFYWGNMTFVAGATPVYTPVKLTGVKDIIAISAKNDGFHALLLDEDGKCFVLGHNHYGQLGTGDKIPKLTPFLIAENIVEIMAGETFSYIIDNKGNLLAAGGKDYRGNVVWFNDAISTQYEFKKVVLPMEPFTLCQPKVVQTGTFQKVEICESDSVAFDGTYVREAGFYYQTLLNDQKLDTIATLELIVKKSSAAMRIEVPLCEGEPLLINGQSYTIVDSLAIHYSNVAGCDSVLTYYPKWLKSTSATINLAKCANQLSVRHADRIFEDTGRFVFTLSNYQGCDSVVTYIIGISQSIDCYPVGLSLPNTFTPNNDGYNDAFGPFGINLTGITSQMKIYNRWGKLVYQDDPIINPWDGLIQGNDALEGTYYYRFIFKINGGNSTTVHGVVNLLR